MAEEERAHSSRRVRRWRSASEKRQIVLLTKEPGASVAEVARAYGVNANQVFQWRRAFERGELAEGSEALLPVTLAAASVTTGVIRVDNKVAEESTATQASDGGAIHIEIPDRAVISIEHGSDPKLVRTVLEILSR